MNPVRKTQPIRSPVSLRVEDLVGFSAVMVSPNGGRAPWVVILLISSQADLC